MGRSEIVRVEARCRAPRPQRTGREEKLDGEDVSWLQKNK